MQWHPDGACEAGFGPSRDAVGEWPAWLSAYDAARTDSAHRDGDQRIIAASDVEDGFAIAYLGPLEQTDDFVPFA